MDCLIKYRFPIQALGGILLAAAWYFVYGSIFFIALIPLFSSILECSHRFIKHKPAEFLIHAVLLVVFIGMSWLPNYHSPLVQTQPWLEAYNLNIMYAFFLSALMINFIPIKHSSYYRSTPEQVAWTNRFMRNTLRIGLLYGILLTALQIVFRAMNHPLDPFLTSNSVVIILFPMIIFFRFLFKKNREYQELT